VEARAPWREADVTADIDPGEPETERYKTTSVLAVENDLINLGLPADTINRIFEILDDHSWRPRTRFAARGPYKIHCVWTPDGYKVDTRIVEIEVPANRIPSDTSLLQGEWTISPLLRELAPATREIAKLYATLSAIVKADPNLWDGSPIGERKVIDTYGDAGRKLREAFLNIHSSTDIKDSE
jgi:hypothetical protein